MRIPKKFDLGARRYRVRVMPKMSVYGSVMPPRSLMLISKERPARMTRTFWHELMHAVLYDMNHPLTADEKFVEAVAVRLTQVVRTVEL